MNAQMNDGHLVRCPYGSRNVYVIKGSLIFRSDTVLIALTEKAAEIGELRKASLIRNDVDPMEFINYSGHSLPKYGVCSLLVNGDDIVSIKIGETLYYPESWYKSIRP